jgi:hypothetical protein
MCMCRAKTLVINPQRMRKVTVVVLCVCVCLSVYLSVCYQATCYIPGLYVENKVLLGFIWHF